MPRTSLSFDSVSETFWDAVVLGAGPAGALAARQLAIGGAKVLIVEKRAFPRWKVCGTCLNGQALAALSSVGLGELVDQQAGEILDEFCIRLGGLEARFPLPEGRSLTRARFDTALVEAAQDSGAHYLGETTGQVGAAKPDRRVVRLEHAGRETLVESRVVVVAAGLGNRCLEHENMIQTKVASAAKIGAGCVVLDFPDTYRRQVIFMAVGKPGYVGMVRVEDGSLNVAAAFDRNWLKRLGGPAQAATQVLAEAGFPAIPALETVAWQGTGALTRRTSPIAGERLFLLGDAAGYVEPFTGEGMGWALTAAKGLAPLALRGIERWDPAIEREWSALHHRLIGRRQRFCRWLSRTLRHPKVARIVLEIASRIPRVSRLMIEHLNSPPLLTSSQLS